jgi:hypothetical protein
MAGVVSGELVATKPFVLRAGRIIAREDALDTGEKP